jgi:hypothetical protein
MARTKLEVSKEELQAVIDKLEGEREFANPSELWMAVENTEWAKGMEPRPLKAATVYQRAKELGCIIKTKPGKKGRQAGVPRGEVNRVSRAEKISKIPGSEDYFSRLRQFTPPRFLPLVDRIEAGSRSAANKLMCIQCCAYEVKEVKFCQSKACPLWGFRPYQKVDLDKMSEESLVEDENKEEDAA